MQKNVFIKNLNIFFEKKLVLIDKYCIFAVLKLNSFVTLRTKTKGL